MNSATMATQHLFHNLIFLPLHLTTTAIFSLHRHNHHHIKPQFSGFAVRRPISITITPLSCTAVENIAATSEPEETEELEISESVEENEKVKSVKELVKRAVPELSVKEKKELGSYAHSLGDKLKAQQIGKSGVTGNVAFAFDESLESNELLKLKIHRSCPGELEDVIRQLEEATGSVVVSQIGRTVILYRPSITKLKAEEKKEQNRRVYEQKRKKFQAAPTTVQRWKKRD